MEAPMDTTPAIKLIEKAKHIGLVLPQHPHHDTLAAAEILVRFLTSRAIYVGMVTKLNLASLTHENTFSTLHSLKTLTKEFIISLNTAQAPISQLRYEHKDGRVDIIISPSSYSILQDHTSFREGNTQCDCIITLGIDDIEQIDATPWDRHSSSFSETPVIAMDISEKHTHYGDVNLVDSTLSSLAELVYRFLASFPDHTISGENATLLLSGILHHTQDFSVLAHANTLLSSHELIGLGAEYETARILSRTSLPFSLTPLVGRALARSRMDEQKKIVWSSVTQDDFTLTHCSPQDISGVLDRIKKEFPLARACVLLWQDPDDQIIHIRIAADTRLLELMRKKTQVRFDDVNIELADAYDSFPDAESVALALLDAVL